MNLSIRFFLYLPNAYCLFLIQTMYTIKSESKDGLKTVLSTKLPKKYWFLNSFSLLFS